MTAELGLPPITPPTGPPCHHDALAYVECNCPVGEHRYCTGCAEIVTEPCPLEER